MSEPTREQHAADPPAPGRGVLRLLVIVLSPLLFLGTAAIGLTLRRSYPTAVLVPWTLLVLFVAAFVLAWSGSLLHHLAEWRRPLRRLEKTLEGIREGSTPIEELGGFDGPIGPVAQQVRQILHDLRQAKADMVNVEREMRQRVAQRTNAMERLIGSLRTQANRDGLTGLFNRRMLEQHLATVFDQAQASCTNLCVIMLDLDNFKLLNDTLGHAAGDEFLRSVGQLIRSTVRDQDLPFRYGGDEFLVLMPEAGADAGEALAQRLVSLADALGRTLKLPRPVGLSAGWACLTELSDPKLTRLKEQADERLYASKRARKAGRPPTSAPPSSSLVRDPRSSAASPAR